MTADDMPEVHIPAFVMSMDDAHLLRRLMVYVSEHSLRPPRWPDCDTGSCPSCLAEYFLTVLDTIPEPAP